MAVNNPYATYKQTSMETKSAGELTLMLYEGCLKFIKRAEKAIEAKNMEEKNLQLMKAQAIIRELTVTLNTEIEVSRNMLQLYEYILSQLVEANTKNDLEALKNAESFVADFTETWKEVIKLDRVQRHGSGQDKQPVGSKPQAATTGSAPSAAAPSASAPQPEPAKAAEQQAAPVQPAVNPYAKQNINNPYAKAKQAAAVAASFRG